MTRVHQANPAEFDWIKVSAGRRCPICGGGTGCKTHSEGNFAACGQEPSDWPLTSGAWLHRLGAVASGHLAANDASTAPSALPSVAGSAS